MNRRRSLPQANTLRAAARATLVAVLLATVCTLGCQPSEPVTLKLNLQNGDRYRSMMEMEQVMTMNVMGEQKLTQRTNLDTTMVVKSTNDDGTYTIGVTYDAASLSQEGAGTSFTYDSRTGGQAPPQAAGYAALLGRELEMDITAEGSVFDLRGEEDLFEAMLRAVDLPDGPQGDMLRRQMRDAFKPEEFTRMMEASFNYLPFREVRVGGTWKRTNEVRFGFPLQVSDTYKLNSIRDGIAAISVVGELASGEGSMIALGAGSMQINVSGVQNGLLTVDMASGMLLSGKITQTYGGSFTMVMGEAGSPGMTIPVEATTTVAVTAERLDGE